MNQRPALPWSSLGDADFDAEHLTLRAEIDRLKDICVQPDAALPCPCSTENNARCLERIAQQIGDLLAYAVSHFALEEGIMRLAPRNTANLQLGQAHMRDHARIAQGLSLQAHTLDTMSPRLSIRQLSEQLNDWLKHHTPEFDAQLAGMLATRELPAAGAVSNSVSSSEPSTNAKTGIPIAFRSKYEMPRPPRSDKSK